jgi:hypothetical protein
MTLLPAAFRLKDKKPAIRLEALKGLASLYASYISRTYVVPTAPPHSMSQEAHHE